MEDGSIRDKNVLTELITLSARTQHERVGRSDVVIEMEDRRTPKPQVCCHGSL